MTYFGRHLVRGSSGREYAFDSFDLDAEFADVGAIYIFARQSFGLLPPSLDLIYVGKATELGSRLSSHEKWPQALRMGANRLLVMKVGHLTDRTSVEEDIIAFNCPALNDTLNPMAHYLNGLGIRPSDHPKNALADIAAAMTSAPPPSPKNALATIASTMSSGHHTAAMRPRGLIRD
jgi:hypothetical protein